jgi:cation transport ATPase
LIPSALFGWTRIGIAVLFHEGSTLIVVANALRLLRYKATLLYSPRAFTNVKAVQGRH